MNYDEFCALWETLTEDQRDSVRAKAVWEHMTLWAVCRSWPGIWADRQRVQAVRASKKDAKTRQALGRRAT